jgi:hypothetical protein
MAETLRILLEPRQRAAPVRVVESLGRAVPLALDRVAE